MKADARPANWLLGFLGAAAGGALGYFAFFWIARQGFYALALPGLFLGLGCGSLSRGTSRALGIVCAVAAVILGLIVEWQFAPFKADGSLTFFLTHVGDLQPITLISIGVGALFAYWCGTVSPFGGRDRDEGRNLKDEDADGGPQNRPPSAAEKS
jgi:hypothetical protein